MILDYEILDAQRVWRPNGNDGHGAFSIKIKVRHENEDRIMFIEHNNDGHGLFQIVDEANGKEAILTFDIAKHVLKNHFEKVIEIFGVHHPEHLFKILPFTGEYQNRFFKDHEYFL